MIITVFKRLFTSLPMTSF